MDKDEYIKMLYQRTEYLKSEIADFENCKGELEQSKLWAIKEQVSRIFGLIDVCDKELFPNTIRCPQTNEEWFCGLSTEEKATFLASNKMLNFDYQMWIEWLNEVHK